MMNFKALIIICVYSSKFVNSANQNSEVLPILTYEDFGGQLEGEKGWEVVGNGSAIFSKSKSDLNVNCVADYPIEWKIVGHIMPSEFVKFQPTQFRLINATHSYKIKIIIFFNPVDDCYSSSVITCQRVSNVIEKSSIQIFVPGDKPLITPGYENEVIIKDKTLIPCPTTNPNIPVTLLKLQKDGTEEVINDVVYNPVTGFQLNGPITGKLICSSGNDRIAFKSVVSNIADGDDYLPKTERLKAFTGDKILLNCSSQEMVELVSDMDLNYNIKSDDRLVVHVTSQTARNGSIHCNGAAGRSIWVWQVEFVDAPELQLDNFESEVNCLSDHPSRSVSTVRCRNPSDCQFMKQCFKNASFCNYKRQKQFFSDFPTRCWVQERGSGASCASVPYSHLNGIVQCTVSELTKHWEMFTSLGFKKYSNWEDAPETELIKMDQVDNILFTNRKSEFFCEAVAYLFAESLKFSIEFENGTTQFLKDSEYTNPGIESSRKIDELNILGQLKIDLPVEAVAIKCYAFWWNSTDFLTTERRFTVKQLQPPTVITQDARVSFTVDETNRRLKCFGVGEPSPHYLWIKDDQVIEESEGTEFSTGSKSEGILTFPVVKKSTAGIYICKIENSVGSANVTFTVDIMEGGSGNTTCRCAAE